MSVYQNEADFRMLPREKARTLFPQFHSTEIHYLTLSTYAPLLGTTSTATIPTVLLQAISSTTHLMCNEMPSSASLATLLQSLPQELYDEIYELVFTADQSEIVDLESDNPFPARLYVDHHSRELFAKSYYANTTFTLQRTRMDIFSRWAKSLSWRHYGLVGSFIVKVEMLRAAKGRSVEKQRGLAAAALCDIADFLVRGAFGKGIRGALRVQVWIGSEEGITTETYKAWSVRTGGAGA